MSFREGCDAGANIGRKRRSLARCHIHVQRHVFGRGREPAFGGVMQFFECMHAFFVRRDQHDRDLHRIAEVYFAQVADVAFGGEGRAATGLHVFGTDADLQP